MNRRHFLATTTAALASICVSPAGDTHDIAVSEPILGTFTETYEWKNFEYDHTIGLRYDGPEGRYWVGCALQGITRSDSDDKYIPFLQPSLRAELERCILECRKTGEFRAWPEAGQRIRLP